MRPAQGPLIAAAFVLFATACSTTPATPTATTAAVDLYSGTWSGTLTDDALGVGRAQLTLSPQAVGWSGSWSVTFTRPDHVAGAGGSASLVPNALSQSSPPVLQLFCPSNSENMSFDVHVDSNHHLIASYTNVPVSAAFASSPCIGMVRGALDLAKQ
jgi:hypothetical protein